MLQGVEGDIDADRSDEAIALQDRRHPAQAKDRQSGQQVLVVWTKDHFLSRVAGKKIPAAERGGIVPVATLQAQSAIVAVPARREATGGVVTFPVGKFLITTIESVRLEDAPKPEIFGIAFHGAAQQSNDQ